MIENTIAFLIRSAVADWPSYLLLLGLFFLFRYLIQRFCGNLAERMRAFIVGEKNLYNSDQDELEQIVKRISASRDAQMMEELEVYCQSNPRRLRAWQEYARLLLELFEDAPAACELLERAVSRVRSKQDKALLLYRAGMICREHRNDEQEAQRFFSEAAKKYPRTTYGGLSQDELYSAH